MEQTKSVRPFGMRDKIGYLFGDFGNDIMLVFVSQFLMVFYTQVWGMKPTVVGTMFLVARLIDAFTDVTMGRIIDVTPQGRDGKFKKWIRIMALPVTIASFLMYQSALRDQPMAFKIIYMYITYLLYRDGKFKKWIRIMALPVTIASFLMYQSALRDQPMAFKIIYMYITYLLYGSICFTGVNIPYGAMASAITDKPDERQSLITFRAIGAYVGEFMVGFFGPIIIYERVMNNGVMASAITDKPDERQSLITFRAIGAYVGEFMVGFFGPIIIYERVMNNGVTQVFIRNNGNIFPVMAGGISIVALICYYICYTCTTERIKVPPLPKGEGISFFKSVKMIVSNRAMIGILGGTVCLIFGNLLTGGVNAYLYAYYFKMPAALSTYNAIKLGIALSMATVVTLIVKKLGKREAGVNAYLYAYYFKMPAALSTYNAIKLGIALSMATVVTLIVKKLGKREAISIAVGFAAVVFAALSFLHIKNPWVYVGIASVGFSGVTFFGYVIWGAIIDVIDDAEIKTGKREDGTLYAIYSFSRKVGQALGSSLVGYALAIIGFQSGVKEQTQEVLDGIYGTLYAIYSFSRKVGQALGSSLVGYALAIIGFQSGVKEQTQEVLDGIYRLATVAPATLFTLVVIMFMLVYPLSKKRVDANAETLRLRREAKEKEAEAK